MISRLVGEATHTQRLPHRRAAHADLLRKRYLGEPLPRREPFEHYHLLYLRIGDARRRLFQKTVHKKSP